MNLTEIQVAIAKLEQAKGWINTPDQKMTFLVEELGEAAKWVRRARAQQLTDQEKQELNYELADVLQHLISLANDFELNLEQGLVQKKGLHPDA